MSRRLEMVNSVIREVISDAIQHRLSDPRISPFASVTRVEVSGDLQLANVYISVMGTEQEQRRCLRGLLHARGHVQTLLARRIRSRHCPHLEFALDLSIKKAADTIRVIDEAIGEKTSAEKTSAESLTDTPSDETPQHHVTQHHVSQHHVSPHHVSPHHVSPHHVSQGPFADFSEDCAPVEQADSSAAQARLKNRESGHSSEDASEDTGECT